MNKAKIITQETAAKDLCFFVELQAGSYRLSTEAPFRSSSAAESYVREVFRDLGERCFNIEQVMLNGKTARIQ